MNDFTKEELQEIHRCLKCIVKSGINPYSCVTLDVKKKVHSMIDNYCEHEILVTENDSGHGHNWTNTCRKCGNSIR